MGENGRPLRAFLSIVLFLGAILLAVRVSRCERVADRDEQETRVETRLNRDTVYIQKPVAVRDTIVRYATLRVRHEVHDTVSTRDTMAVSLEDTIRLPITQKVYSDSNYTAYVSGYEPSLDSIEVYHSTIERTITITKTSKPRRWNVSVVAGYGIGMKNKDFEPFVGIGISYNLTR